jgi:eukaryotic-like serine/threonine-protein kinase
VVLVGTIIALLAAPGSKPTPSPTAPATSHSPTPTPTPTNTLVTLQASDIVGKTKAQAQATLQSLGLVLAASNGDPAPTAAQVGTAESVQPVGNLAPGTTVNVTFYTAVAPPPAPTAPTAVTPQSSYPAGGTVPVQWIQYTGCPASQPLSGYQITVVSGIATPTTTNPDTTQVVVQTGSAASSGTTSVTYVAVCGTGNSAVQSAASPALQLPYS